MDAPCVGLRLLGDIETPCLFKTKKTHQMFMIQHGIAYSAICHFRTLDLMDFVVFYSSLVSLFESSRKGDNLHLREVSYSG